MAVNFDVMDLGKARLLDPEQMGYKDSLEIIKDESLKVQKSFVKIGWYLKHIKDQELYKEEGYANICECAADQLGYSQSTTSRLINICERFSKNGNTPELDEKYAGFDKSQMIEMLPMEPEQLEKVTPDMTVAEIRAVKNEANPIAEPDDGEIREFCQLVLEDISEDDKSNLKEYMIRQYGKRHEGGSADGITYRCSLRGIRINDSDEITWAHFAKRVLELEELIPGSCFGTKATEDMNDENIPGQMNIEEDFPEYLPESLPETCEVSDGECKEVAEQLSAYGLPKTEYPEGSLLTTEGCGHQYDCFLCAQECDIRQKERTCREATCENPYGCQTMNKLGDIRWDKGDRCQFINLELTYKTAGSGEPDPCCKECILRNECDFCCDAAKLRILRENEIVVTPQDSVMMETDERAEQIDVVSDSELREKEPELPILKNNDQRQEWLSNYKAWGLWYRDENIDVNYYKFDFTDGSRLVVSEYPLRQSYWSNERRDECFYHLLEKSKHGYDGTYDETYRHKEDSETYLIGFLKNLQK
ncbi:MAG: hypothetical protein HDP34_00860 [Clostridia bacterium]|nr:hypothetical protein [Clostridia bacterium]